MNRARDLILKLYKNENITKEEVDILLDGIEGKIWCYNTPTYQPYIDWTYKPYEQPKWTITSNTNSNNVE